MSDVHRYIDANLDRFREELFEFLRIPSVSARSEHQAGHARGPRIGSRSRCARSGWRRRSRRRSGHPIVSGEWRGAGADAPTVLIYGHYDVQPPEPLELWTSPPFEPELRDGRIYARGSVDDKGQLYLHIKAIEAHLQHDGPSPGQRHRPRGGEEEVGSAQPRCPSSRRTRRGSAADAIVISDSAMFAPGMPSIGASLRGLAYFEIEVEGPVAGPALRELRRRRGQPGHGARTHPRVAPRRGLACRDRRLLRQRRHRAGVPGADPRSCPFDDEEFRAETGAPALGGEGGYTTLERLWIRPTVEVNGMISGYTGEGPKTVLPSKAMAKVSCRLVPDQDPRKIERALPGARRGASRPRAYA